MRKIDIPSKDKLWSFVVEKGREVEPRSNGITNKFDVNDVNTILCTMEYFNATDIWIQQTNYDLAGPPRYRLFDWLGMCIMSRNNDDRKQNEMALKVLVYSWLKTGGKPEEFIADLRIVDYEIDRAWERIEIPE